MLGRTSLGAVLMLLVGARVAAGVTETPRPLVRVDTGERSWRLTGSVFSRKTNKVLKVPSWTGTYELVLPTGPGTSRPPASKLPTITATVYYFPTLERTKDVMISPSAGGFKTDLAPQLAGVDEASGIMLQVGAESKRELPDTAPGKHLVEVRARRGTITFSFTGRPVGVELLAFAKEFLNGNRVLGEWKETEIAIDASAGERKHKLGGSVAADEMWRGTVNLAEKNDLTLELLLKRVSYRVESSGIARGEESPLEGARITVEAQGDKLRGTTDAEGRVAISIGRVTQRRAVRFSVIAPGQEHPTQGLLTLRYGREKEKLLDAGKYQVTAAPGTPVADEVSKRTLDFLKAIFNDDAARFPRSLDQDKLGPVEYAPQPHFLHVVTWRLAKEVKDKETSRTARACLPLEKLEDGRAASDAALAAGLESLEAALGLAVETGDVAWVHAADVKVRELQALRNADKPAWGERTARACLGLWRLAELARDPEREAQAKRETDALMRAIAADAEPTETVVSKKGVREIPKSGSAAAHAWAALAFWKGFELVGEAGYKATAIAQVQHLVEKHLEQGVVGYSHMEKGEHPELARSTFVGEGAYPETAAAVHALLLTFHHTHDRSYSDQALKIRSRVLGYWRKDYGGFGKLEYWESATAGSKDPKAGLKPLSSKRQASAYQQPWALNVFLPTFYPYWGEAVKEERPSRGLLDFLFNRKREE